MTDMDQRVAILEEQNRQQTRELAKLEASVDHKLAAMQRDVSDIKETLSKQRGFWAGVTFVASIVGFALSQLWGHIKGVAS